MKLTSYHAKYCAYELTWRCPPDRDDRLAGALVDARVDLTAELSRCEWGRDDYSLEVASLQPAPPGQQALALAD